MSQVQHEEHIFLFSALASQIMSNVPATLLFAKFTRHWQALLWGANTGGFGSLLGSFANLIAYKIYITRANVRQKRGFLLRFVAIGYVFFFLMVGLYFLLMRVGVFL